MASPDLQCSRIFSARQLHRVEDAERELVDSRLRPLDSLGLPHESLGQNPIALSLSEYRDVRQRIEQINSYVSPTGR